MAYTHLTTDELASITSPFSCPKSWVHYKTPLFEKNLTDEFSAIFFKS